MTRLLICCPQDIPSVNMAAFLRRNGDWEDIGSDGENSYLRRGDDVMMTISGLHITSELIDQKAKGFGIVPDEMVFMSRHKAASGIPTLTVHPIGNYKTADFGGRDGTLVRSSPSSMSQALRLISAYNDTDLYKVSFEVTHHGPYLETPTYFIEIGSDETHWGDEHAAEILGRVIEDVPEDGGYIQAIGVGGGHYAPRFTEMVLGYKIDIGHMVPGYQLDGMDDDTICDYMRKASEATGGTKCVYLHKKAFKKSEQHRIEGLIGSLGFEILSSKDLDPIQ
ncbi:MAG: D-aminoacyl-tRNA deacylase [Candidatus Methanomethylophilaceae archaeon]|nr:D-aminoacyl-tRNA deacylase [Candidatus Methanomethylophilaceae archaeon]